MPFNGSGTFAREGGSTAWTDDRNEGVKIRSDLHDEHDQDIADGLTGCITKDGQTTTTARIPFASGIRIPAGSEASPSINITGDLATGFYSPTGSTVAISIGGTERARFAGSQAIISTLGSNALAVGANGSTAPVFRVNTGAASVATGIQIDGAAAGGGVSVFAITSGTNENLTLNAAGTGTVTFGNTSTGAIQFSRNAVPTASDGAALGTSSLMWSDLFLASGSVIDWNNGDLALTHTANALTLTGGTLDVPAILQGGAGTPRVKIDVAVNFNSANTDHAITVAIPSWATKYRPIGCFLHGTTGAANSATFGVFTATAGGGTAIVAGSTACTITNNTDGTAANTQAAAIATTTSTFTLAGFPTLYFRVQTAHGSAVTGTVTIELLALS